MPKIKAESIPAHKQKTRNDILDAAEHLFARHGYLDVSLGDVADLAEIGRTTLYEYFPNKQELLLGLIEDRVPPVLEKIVAELDPALTPAGQLEQLFRRTLCFAARNAHLTVIITRAGRKLATPLQDRMWATLDPVIYEIARLVAAGTSSGEFIDRPVPALARIAADLIMGAVDELMRHPDPEGRFRFVFEHWVEFLLRGLGLADPFPPGSDRAQRP